MAGTELSHDGKILTVQIPMAIRKRGGRKLVVWPNTTDGWAAPTRPRIDNTLLRAVV